MSKIGRPKGTTKLDKKIKKGPFWFKRNIVNWLETKKNMTKTIENALEKEMERENETI